MTAASYEYSSESSGEFYNISDPPCIESIITVNVVTTFVSSADYTLLVLCMCSSALQCYVIKMACQHIRRGNGDQCLHVFLLSMTFGDLLLTSLCYPMEFVPRLGWATIPRFVNITVHFLTWVALSGSSLSLVLLNLEKLLYFKYPLRYSAFVTRRKGVIVSISVWSACVLFVSCAWLLGCFICMDGTCSVLHLLPDKKVMYLVFSISVCIVPTVTSLAVALYILKVVSSHRKKLAEEQALYSNGQNGMSHTVSRLRTFYFIFMTTVFTAATLLPYRLYQMKMQYYIEPAAFTQKKTCASIMEMWLMNYLISCNAILNPLITVTVLPQYRCLFVKKILGGSVCENATKPTEL